MSGLSPRVRGNLNIAGSGDGSANIIRSIPARAGEPRAMPNVSSCGLSPPCGGTSGSEGVTAVYPRACGGTTGSLPCRNPNVDISVYPRACGGTDVR